MYAVIEAGGKQHRVVEGEVIRVEKIEAETGSTIDFDRVLMVGEGESIKVGAPVVDGAKVSAEVIQHGRGDKVTIVKFKRRKHHMKRQGHRQAFTRLEVLAIGDSKTVKAPAEKKEKKAIDKPDTKVEAKKPVEKKVSADKKAPAKKTEKKPAPVKSDK